MFYGRFKRRMFSMIIQLLINNVSRRLVLQEVDREHNFNLVSSEFGYAFLGSDDESFSKRIDVSLHLLHFVHAKKNARFYLNHMRIVNGRFNNSYKDGLCYGSV